jgi:hypothetical protein
MKAKRAHIVLPDDLLADVDALVGPRGRSAFLAQVIRDEVNRRRLLQILSNPEPVLKDEDYPEFADGSYEWVRRSRDEDLRLQQEKLGNWLDRGAAKS